MQPVTVLLVDDDPAFLDEASLVFERHPEVTLAAFVSKGKEALPKANQLKPDVVLVDIKMPDLPGLDVIRILRQAIPNLGIIALTGFDEDEFREGSLAAGADAFVTKNAMRKELIPAIQKVAADRFKQNPNPANLKPTRGLLLRS